MILLGKYVENLFKYRISLSLDTNCNDEIFVLLPNV